MPYRLSSEKLIKVQIRLDTYMFQTQLMIEKALNDFI